MSEEPKWEYVLRDIKEQNAVLLLGPGLLPNAQKDLYKKFKENEDIGDKLLYFYEREGLFLFADDDAKTFAQWVAGQYFEKCKPDESLLKKIIQLPFKLIVSTNPDASLKNAFTKYCLKSQFDYYSWQPKDVEDQNLSRPTAEFPLIYNLCGYYKDNTTLILDYDDIINLLKNLLTNNRVPEDIFRTPLQKATTFIFFGFQFERWYTQLFLRYLNYGGQDIPTHKSRNYALKTSFTEEDTKQFFMKQFNVRFIGADVGDFEKLYDLFSENYGDSLRNIVDELSTSAATVVQLIELNNFDAAISKLRSFETQFDSNDLNELVITESNYYAYLEEKNAATSSSEHMTNQLNRIRINLLKLAKKLK